MARNVNRNTPGYEALTPAQAAAIGHLLAGRTGRETAAAVGVTEETVSRWRTSSPAFAAALNVGRAELHTEQLDALRQLRHKAVSVLRELLDAEDTAVRFKAAALVLRVDVGAPAGPQTPEQVAQEWTEERSVSESDRLMAMIARSTDGTLILPYAPEPE